MRMQAGSRSINRKELFLSGNVSKRAIGALPMCAPCDFGHDTIAISCPQQMFKAPYVITTFSYLFNLLSIV